MPSKQHEREKESLDSSYAMTLCSYSQTCDTTDVNQHLPTTPQKSASPSSLFIPAFLDRICRKKSSSSSFTPHFILILVILLHTLSLLMMTNPVSGALSRSQVKKKLRKNSPIYYIQTPYNFVNSQPFLSGLSTYSSLSSSLLMNRHVNRPLISSTLYHLPTKYVSNAKPVDVSSKKTSKKKGVSKHGSKASNTISRKVIAPSTSTTTTSTTTTSTTTTLTPPVIEVQDVQSKGHRRKGVSSSSSFKTNSKKKRKESKLIYMPLTFVSNAKPFKINSTTGTSKGKNRVNYSDRHSSYSYSF